MSLRTGNPVKFRGVDYPSSAAVAAAYGIKRAAVNYRTRHKGEMPEQALEVLASSDTAKSSIHIQNSIGAVNVGPGMTSIPEEEFEAAREMFAEAGITVRHIDEGKN